MAGALFGLASRKDLSTFDSSTFAQEKRRFLTISSTSEAGGGDVDGTKSKGSGKVNKGRDGGKDKTGVGGASRPQSVESQGLEGGSKPEKHRRGRGKERRSGNENGKGEEKTKKKGKDGGRRGGEGMGGSEEEMTGTETDMTGTEKDGSSGGEGGVDGAEASASKDGDGWKKERKHDRRLSAVLSEGGDGSRRNSYNFPGGGDLVGREWNPSGGTMTNLAASEADSNGDRADGVVMYERDGVMKRREVAAKSDGEKAVFKPTQATGPKYAAAKTLQQKHLNPKPWTLQQKHLNPGPYTLHQTSHIQHLAPYTLHPTPYTQHPTPYTLRRRRV